jgi:hypothetical protein
MQALQPMQRRLSKSTMPSARRYSALVGQISVHGESSQWLHRITPKWRDVCGNAPFSMCFTQVRKTPSGTWCSSLHATVQAWQPMQRSWSMTNPYRIFGVRSPVARLKKVFGFDIIADSCKMRTDAARGEVKKNCRVESKAVPEWERWPEGASSADSKFRLFVPGEQL